MPLSQKNTFQADMDVQGGQFFSLINEIAGVCANVQKMLGYSDSGIIIDRPEASSTTTSSTTGTSASPLTLASGTSETANSPAWDQTSQPSNDGVIVTVQVRTVYDDASAETLYGFSRDFKYDSLGALVSISGETRYTIDVPVVC